MYLPSPHACVDTQTHTHILPLGFRCLYDTHITAELLQSLALPTWEGLCFFCSIIYGLLSSRKLCHFIISPGIKSLTMGRHRKYQDNTWCTVSFFFFSPFDSLPFKIIDDKGLALKVQKGNGRGRWGWESSLY